MLTHVAGTSHEKGASCNITLEGTAAKGMGIAWVQAQEDEGTSHQLSENFPPSSVYLLPSNLERSELQLNYIREVIPLRRREKRGNETCIVDYYRRWETTSMLF